MIEIGPDGAWRFDFDPARRLLRIHLSGFWSSETMDVYERVLPHRMRALHATGRGCACVVDARDLPLQSKEISDRQNALLEAVRPYHPDRAALILLPGVLMRMQVSRIASPVERQRLFSSEEEAMAWVLAEGTAGA